MSLRSQAHPDDLAFGNRRVMLGSLPLEQISAEMTEVVREALKSVLQAGRHIDPNNLSIVFEPDVQPEHMRFSFWIVGRGEKPPVGVPLLKVEGVEHEFSH